jgi:hypothetical protein
MSACPGRKTGDRPASSAGQAFAGHALLSRASRRSIQTTCLYCCRFRSPTYTNAYPKFHVVDGTGTNKAARGLVTRACAVRLGVVIAVTGASCPGRAPASVARRRADPGPSTKHSRSDNHVPLRGDCCAGPRITRRRCAPRGPGYAIADIMAGPAEGRIDTSDLAFHRRPPHHAMNRWSARRIACGRKPRLPFACQTVTPVGPRWPRSKDQSTIGVPAGVPISTMAPSPCNPRLTALPRCKDVDARDGAPRALARGDPDKPGHDGGQ